MKRDARQGPGGEATSTVPGARSLVVFGAVVLAVAAVVAAAAVAAGGDGSAGTGAEAPGAAVIQLHDAVDELDTDRALALMPPGEAAELRAPLDRLQRSLEAIGVEAPTWLPALPPVSVVGTERIEEDVVRVALAYPGGGVDDHVVTVRERGRWYVSPWYTLLDSELQLEEEQRRDAVEPRGSPTPDGALDGLLEAAATGDAAAVVAMLDPRAAAAFQRHGEQLDDGDSALYGIGRGLRFHVGNPLLLDLSEGGTVVDRGRTTTVEDGDQHFLIVHAAEARSSSPRGVFAYQDGCVEVVAGQAGRSRCRLLESGFDISPEIDPPLIGMVPWPLLPLYAFSLEDWEVASDAGYVVVRRGDRWYVQLMASRIINAALAVEALDPEQAASVRACIEGGFDPVGASCDDVAPS